MTPEQAANLPDSGKMDVATAFALKPFDHHTFYFDYHGEQIVTGIERSDHGRFTLYLNVSDFWTVNGDELLTYRRNAEARL